MLEKNQKEQVTGLTLRNCKFSAQKLNKYNFSENLFMKRSFVL